MKVRGRYMEELRESAWFGRVSTEVGVSKSGKIGDNTKDDRPTCSTVGASMTMVWMDRL